MDTGKSSSWYVYIVECHDRSYYTGITTDVARRISEHNHSSKGAKYTRARRPVSLRHQEKHRDKSAALKREIAIKKMTRNEKSALWL